MGSFLKPYLHIPDVLSLEDVEFLKSSYKRHLSVEGIPCYALLDSLQSTTFKKIEAAIEQSLSEKIYYLNDFYMYTDSSFRTDWHVDTELFAFDCALNAWILLFPEEIESPIAFVRGLNDGSHEGRFHSVRPDAGDYVFGNYSTGKIIRRSQSSVEAERISTPGVKVGDILVLNPSQFHRTNVLRPKHAMALKFVLKGPSGFLSDEQVDPVFWPEVGVFNRLVKPARDWKNVIDGIRAALRSEDGRKELSAGFYPEKFELYRNKVALL